MPIKAWRKIRAKSACEKDLAKVAREFVRSRLSQAQSIKLAGVERGKYFRIVADVIYDGKSIAQELQAARLAVPYDGGRKAKVDWCQYQRLQPAQASLATP